MIHNDHLGTPQKMTNSSGDVVWAADYKPFGEATITVSTITNNLRGTGQYFDAETGLLYNYFRDLNPAIGRYIEKDRIGLRGGINLYAFVLNNPLKYVDPRGLRCTYTQSTGQMTCINDQTGEQYYNENGYSGTGEGRNNPAMQDVPDTGPIPQGSWQWGSPYDSPNTGRNTIPLTPLEGNQCLNTRRDCDSFRAHGNNARNDASQGCIVLPPNRTRIPAGETVNVVP